MLTAGLALHAKKHAAYCSDSGGWGRSIRGGAEKAQGLGEVEGVAVGGEAVELPEEAVELPEWQVLLGEGTADVCWRMLTYAGLC